MNVPRLVTDNPAYYGRVRVEAQDAIEDWELNFNLGSVVKYIARADRQGTAEQDLMKALWYLQREIRRRGMNL